MTQQHDIGLKALPKGDLSESKKRYAVGVMSSFSLLAPTCLRTVANLSIGFAIDVEVLLCFIKNNDGFYGLG